MPIDPATETLLSLSQAARSIPSARTGRGLSTSTVWRWALTGARGVVLETIMLGGSRYTSREALARFFAACSAASGISQPAERTKTQRTRDHERAGAILDAAGIK